MKIDSTAFGATLAQYEGEDRAQAEEGPGFGAAAGLPLFPELPGPAVTPAPAPAQTAATSKGTADPGHAAAGEQLHSEASAAARPTSVAASARGMATSPALSRASGGAGLAAAQSAPVEAAASAQPPKAPSDDVPPPAKKPLWSLRRRSDETGEAQSSAKRPNRQRTMVIGAALFLVGIIAGPWLAHKAVPEPPPASGPGQSVQAIADTLKASALGLPVLTLPAATAGGASPTGGHAAQTEPGTPAPVSPNGEGRYLAMLQSMKSGDAAAATSIHVVPKMGAAAPAEASSGRTSGGVAKPIEAYPAAAIPLEIEQARAGARGAEGSGTQQLVVATGADAAGRYQVLRISFNREGVASALMMPLGGRPQRDASWVFAGDATADGFAVAAISPRHVVLRAPSGRLLELVPQ